MQSSPFFSWHLPARPSRSRRREMAMVLRLRRPPCRRRHLSRQFLRRQEPRSRLQPSSGRASTRSARRSRLPANRAGVVRGWFEPVIPVPGSPRREPAADGIATSAIASARQPRRRGAGWRELTVRLPGVTRQISHAAAFPMERGASGVADGLRTSIATPAPSDHSPEHPCERFRAPSP